MVSCYADYSHVRVSGGGAVPLNEGSYNLKCHFGFPPGTLCGAGDAVIIVAHGAESGSALYSASRGGTSKTQAGLFKTGFLFGLFQCRRRALCRKMENRKSRSGCVRMPWHPVQSNNRHGMWNRAEYGVFYQTPLDCKYTLPDYNPVVCGTGGQYG